MTQQELSELRFKFDCIRSCRDWDLREKELRKVANWCDGRGDKTEADVYCFLSIWCYTQILKRMYPPPCMNDDCEYDD